MNDSMHCLILLPSLDKKLHPSIYGLYLEAFLRSVRSYRRVYHLQRRPVVLGKKHIEAHMTYTRKLYLGVPYA